MSNTVKSFWSDLGFEVGGPLYKGLINWFEKEVPDMGKKIVFVSDSGYIFYQLLKEKGYTNLVFEDISEESLSDIEDNRVIFDNDIVMIDFGWEGDFQYYFEEIKKVRGITSKQEFYYCGILNTDKSRRQMRGKRYKTFLFDFWNNYNIQTVFMADMPVCELFFLSPLKASDSSDHRNEIIEGVRSYLKEYEEEKPQSLAEESVFISVQKLWYLAFSPTEEQAQMIGDLVYEGSCLKSGFSGKKMAFVTQEELDADPETPIYWKQGLLQRNDISFDIKKRVAEYYGMAYPTDDYYKDLHLEGEISYRNYNRWIRNAEKKLISSKKAEENILFSIIVPVYNVVESQLRECIGSVLSQTYKKFELILVEDCSTQPHVVPTLKEYEGNERIRIIYRTQNGNISEATNDGLFAAKGDFIVFMDCDDMLADFALNEMALKLEENPALDFVYSDEDHLSEDGKVRHMPFFKPEWSPDLYMYMNYTNHLSVFRASLAKQTGGLRTPYNGSQDYDFTLRFLELTDNKKVGHVAKILYHWRERKESVAFEIGAKSYAIIAAEKAKDDAIKRRGLKAHLEYVQESMQYYTVYETEGKPLVSIVIPSKDNYEIVKQCIDSITKLTDYKNYEIIVVDNGSRDEIKTQISLYLMEMGAKYIYDKYPFNFSLMCNKGAAAAKGDYVLFLNDDIEVFRSDWIERMLGQAMQPHTGAVGAKLFYPETTIIQHGGVINSGDSPEHLFFGNHDDEEQYFQLHRAVLNCVAVTGACLMISKEKFDKVGGFDESFPVAYNDVDLCFRLHKCGLYNVVRPDCKLFHHESYSRGTDQESEDKLLRLGRERYALYKKHPDLKEKDPFLNINLRTYALEMEPKEKYETLSCIDLNGAASGGIASIDETVISDNVLVRGWSFLQGREDNSELERYLLIEDPYGRVLKAGTCRWERGDVKSIYPEEPGALMSGFICLLKKEELRTDVIPYHLGVMTIDKDGTKIVTWCGQRTPVMREPFPKKQYCKLFEQTANETNAEENDSKETIWGMDKISSDENSLYIEGFAFADLNYHYDYETYIGIGNALYTVQKIERADVAAYYPSKHFLYYTGFRCVIDRNTLAENCEANGSKSEMIIRLRKKYFEKGPDICIHTGNFVDR